jgi:Tol biopolymer transport system component
MRRLALAAAVLLVVSIIGVVPNPTNASYEGAAGRVAYTEIHWAEGGAHTEVYVMNSDGSGARHVSSGSDTPTWSPDGQQLAFRYFTASGQVEVRAVDPAGGNLRVLFRDWSHTMFSWAPDGKQIAYGDTFGVWVADDDGSRATLVADPSTRLEPFGRGAIISVKWSPDGMRLAFVEYAPIGEDASLVGGADFVSIVNVDGSNRRSNVCDAYAAGVSIDWAPDGRTLVCDTRGGDHLMTVEADGSNLTVLTEGSAPVWSPDGKRILYSVGRIWEPEREFRSYDLESGGTSQILADFHGFELNWQPRQGAFWDDEDSVFEANIEWMAATEITKGCNPPYNDKYCPNSHVTRGQMAAFLVRALGLTERLDNPFIDDDDSIFEGDIEKLAKAGITRGCNPPYNDRFCPDRKVTREQMAAFLVRALHLTDDGGGDLFVDDDGSIFERDIDRLAAAGVTKGCNPPTNNRFCPSNHVTRGQMAAFLHRALD